MRRSCPICGSSMFVAFGERPAGRCARCNSLERHRALVAASAALVSDGRGRACLEVGPLNRDVFGTFLRDRGWSYTSVDRWRTGNPHDPRNVGFIDHEADLTDLASLADDSFDLVITQHVIEEIDDYERALGEIARVIRPGGTALLEIPFDRGRVDTIRQPPDRYGNVWRFGADLPSRVDTVFASVEQVPMCEGEYQGTLLVCRTVS